MWKLGGPIGFNKQVVDIVSPNRYIVAMSDDTASNASTVGSISDLPTEEDELALSSPRSPPSMSNLQKDTEQLQKKFKIVKAALTEAKLDKVNQKIEEIEGGEHPGIKEEMDEAEKRRTERLTVAHERKRVKVEAILNEYQAKAQAFEDEKRVSSSSSLDNINT